MINNIIKEYVAIVDHLIKSEIKKNEYLIVEKSKIIGLLNKNAYETAEKKLIYWRELGWIDTDQERLTKRVRIDGRTIPAIKIRLKAYKTLKILAK